MEFPSNYQANKTALLFRKICKITYLSCATNFWFEEIKLRPIFIKSYNSISKALEVIVVLFVVSGWGSLNTQKNLPEKQSYDTYLFAFSHTIIYFEYISVVFYRDRIRNLMFTLTVTLKEVCNDEAIEKLLIKKTWLYLVALVFLSSGSLVSYGFESCVKTFTTNATFTTVIPIWPDVEDRRLVSGIARIVWYIIWWIFVVRVISIYFIILTVAIGLGHQFANLHKYFMDLNNIFEGDSSQEEKERRYEEAVKVGVKMHSTTLWCVKQAQETCSMAYSGQILINITVLCLLMMQLTMQLERTLMNLVPIVTLAGSVLLGSGIFMWNAGDITIEESRLPTAVFLSGWHNCRGRLSVRIRKLVTITITQAQKPVVLKVLGVMELSYQSYVSIVKSSYSLFSLLY